MNKLYITIRFSFCAIRAMRVLLDCGFWSASLLLILSTGLFACSSEGSGGVQSRNPTPQERAGQFQTDIDELLDPDFSVHAIASESVGGLPCVPESDEPEFVKCCEDSAANFWLVAAEGCEAYQDRLFEYFFMGGAFAPVL